MAQGSLEDDGVAGAVDPRRLVFVDEMGANAALSPPYAYAPKGRRAYAQEVPRLPRGEHHAACGHEP
jgi:hypothetical protein